MDADEVLGRRDVVVDEHHPAGQRVRRARRARADREMVDQQVVRSDCRRPSRDSRSSDPRAADRRSRRRSRTRSRRRAARAGCRAPRGRSRRRSRAWRGPGGRAARHGGTRVMRARAACGRASTAPAGIRPGPRSPAAGPARRRANQPGSGSSGRRRPARRLQPLEHVEVLPLDHRPRVVARGSTRGRCCPSRACSGPFDSSEYSASANSS